MGLSLLCGPVLLFLVLPSGLGEELGVGGIRRKLIMGKRFKERFKEPLINPTWDQVIERDPLMAFSHYLSGRVNVLLEIAEEIVSNLDAGFEEKHVDTGKVSRAESLMWLWILGAYEVVRTMCQAKSCFSDRALAELRHLKKILSVVRMPAAKMEKPGKRKPVTSYRSPAGWDIKKRDLFVNDPEEQQDISARALLSEFERVLLGIGKQDVLARHEESYSSGP